MKIMELRQMLHKAKDLKKCIDEGGRVGSWLLTHNLSDDERYLIILEALTLYEQPRDMGAKMDKKPTGTERVQL